ncbi:MAG: hypothetical protein QME59_03650, partial [Candidatus Hydrothermarchaeota archaeon]|nr:hypothetical protein [Candidatus Hydrothermarchaeota archaeon]
FIILSITFKFDVLLVEKPVSAVEKAQAGVGKVGAGEALGAGSLGESTIQDIFGAPSVAKIEGEKLKLELYPGAGEIKLRDVKERKFSEVQHSAVGISPAEAFSEDIPEKYESIVRVYFEKLAEEK